MLIQEIREAINRGYANSRNKDAAVDPDTVEAITQEVLSIVAKGDKVSIDDAKRILAENNQQAVAIVSIEQDGTVRVTTAGGNRFTRGVIADWGTVLLNKNLSTVPFATAFGWGNKGIPKAVPEADIRALDPSLHEYISHNTHPQAITQEDEMMLREISGMDIPKVNWSPAEAESVERLKTWGLVVQDMGSMRPFALTQKGKDYFKV